MCTIVEEDHRYWHGKPQEGRSVCLLEYCKPNLGADCSNARDGGGRSVAVVIS